MRQRPTDPDGLLAAVRRFVADEALRNVGAWEPRRKALANWDPELVPAEPGARADMPE